MSSNGKSTSEKPKGIDADSSPGPIKPIGTPYVSSNHSIGDPHSKQAKGEVSVTSGLNKLNGKTSVSSGILSGVPKSKNPNEYHGTMDKLVLLVGSFPFLGRELGSRDRTRGSFLAGTRGSRSCLEAGGNGTGAPLRQDPVPLVLLAWIPFKSELILNPAGEVLARGIMEPLRLGSVDLRKKVETLLPLAPFLFPDRPFLS
ncbi:hypothetical protein HID58_091814 [Brassica napus]|uniref:Uncharacterized protein n=1 Tax=Brassica napus TaxID=3708 RepID=A0ABQ7X0T2_BRANA|nr:hypothetical protein HID58_091814 [Brassica napus]